MVGKRLVAGAVAGFVATGPMTLAMERMHRWLPWRERYPLPPSEITSRLTGMLGQRHHVNRQEHAALSLANHFGYGAATGAIYGVAAAWLPLPPAVKGPLYGLGVWLVSYLGLLPALNILRPATDHPARRNLLMIVSHVIWGVVLGLLTERLAPADQDAAG